MATASLLLCAAALADQRYDVSGFDRYEVGADALATSVRYSGTQNLQIIANGAAQRFVARADYTRTDASGTVPVQAEFGQIMSANGALHDTVDGDPDYLTVLNQPFAIELDAQTLSQLLRLRGPLPFTFPAPMTGGTLTGYLQRGAIARVDGQPVVAVAFDATGPTAGGLPDRATLSMNGTMRMRGTAYYATRGAPLLLALRETLAIDGTLVRDGRRSPVRITYERSIRADDTAPALTTADGK